MESIKSMTKDKKLTGITIVEGKGIGKAYFVGRAIQHESIVAISRRDIGDQIMKFNEIREMAKTDYRVYTRNTDGSSTFDSSILNVYEHILDDPAFIGQVVETITTKLYDLESAIRFVSNDFIKRFNAAGTTYFKERSSDMVEICEKLITYVHKDNGRVLSFSEPTVLVVLRAFVPSDILRWDITNIKGIISVSGGKTSHAAIVARSYSIPVVSGISNITDLIKPGDDLFVDADQAVVYVSPSESIITKYYASEKKNSGVFKSLKKKWQRPVYTRDGVHIEVMANISLPDDAISAMENGADGIGLVRTEYLFTNKREFPSEELQIEFYKSIFQKVDKKECVIRMMDIGGDKIPDFFKIPFEFNPFMGWRAIRILLERRELCDKQLRAIMIAGEKYNYKIMFPMVTTLQEWLEAKRIMKEVANSLGIPMPKCGVLFEVPLAILEMETFMKEIDFASIGTNDLLQYLSAADRNNPKVNHLYNATEPAFLKIIKNAIETSKANGIPISICGEMAGNPINTVLLVGLGLTRFSVIPKNIPIIKELLSNFSSMEALENVTHLFAIDNSDGIAREINRINKQLIGHLLAKIPLAENAFV
ncbi:MAG: phosphoenolpyruvate--protein phosphotransferase [Chitinivibrionales bacterium]|nr:phosphoenolpyruvate--protein phosphotransferase [Chitinivibrionales bacterium]